MNKSVNTNEYTCFVKRLLKSILEVWISQDQVAKNIHLQQLHISNIELW